MFWDQDNNNFYIGCSISVKNRVSNHLSDLNKNVHTNYKLQSRYNKWGIPNIEVLELCDSKVLFDKEVSYIEEFDSFNNGLNLTKGADGRCYGEANGAAKYNYNTYKDILYNIAYSGDSYAKIAESLDVTLGTVKHIGSMSTHLYLKDDFPELYAIIRTRNLNYDNSAKSKGIKYPIIVSPEGIEYTVDNLHTFSSTHELQYQNLHKVLTGKRISHKGWKVK